MDIPRTARQGYVYLMRNDVNKTYRYLRRIGARIVDKRILKEKTSDNYYGWMRLPRPLPLWDAMDAGLVPLFNCYRSEATE